MGKNPGKMKEHSVQNGLAEKQKVLKERTERYARPAETEKYRGEQQEGLEFLLTDERYIINAEFVEEVVPLKEISHLPCTPSFILGIINLRGKILSVIDLKHFLTLPGKGLSNQNRVIILRNGEIELGVLVDEVIGRIPFFPDQVKATAVTTQGMRKDYIAGVTAKRSIVFDAGKFLSDEGIIVNEEV